MKGIFPDATGGLDQVLRAVTLPDDPPVTVATHDRIPAEDLPGILSGYDFILDDHNKMPTDALRKCTGVKHIIFLGTGARSYMDPEELADLGITVHIIKGYGDVAVAEHTIALMWAAARDIAMMDRKVRANEWPQPEGRQLRGKTIGLLGFGGIAAEVASIASGAGMRVIAWNRSPKSAPHVEFVDLDTLFAESHVLSLHLLLNDETRGFMNAARIAKIRPGAILVNTARAGIIDEPAMIAALQSGRISHAALDVFNEEPLPAGHTLRTLENVTLATHSGFRTPEATETLLRRGLDIARRLAGIA